MEKPGGKLRPVLAVALALTIFTTAVPFLVSSQETVTIGNRTVTGSIVAQNLKQMLESYKNEIYELRQKVRESKLGKEGEEYIMGILDEAEESLKDVEYYYSQEQYQKLNQELDRVDTKLDTVRREIAFLKAAKTSVSREDNQIPIFILMGLLLLLSFYLLVKIFIVGEPKDKKGKADLSLINSHIKKKPVEKAPLDIRIKRLKEKLKSLGKMEQYRLELELIKEKYHQNLYGMCEDYLMDLEKELEQPQRKGDIKGGG